MGVFSKSNRPLQAGSFFDFNVAQPPVVQPAVGRVAAICFTHVWGPLKKPTRITSLADFLDKFGGDPNNPSSGYIAMYEAFKGEGTPDFGGAGEVIAYRMGGSAAAKASKILQNSAGTPANAITITAKYEGTKGNDLRLTTQDHASDSTKNELIILDQTTVLETYVYADTDINDLAAQINANSDWVTAAVLASGTALGLVASTSLTGGNDGATLVGADYTQAQTDLAIQKFGVLAFQNLTDPTIIASLLSWVQSQNQSGRTFFLVVGGALDETITTAVSRSASLNDQNVINVGVGSVRDNALVDVNDAPLVLSTAQLAPRVAGIVANRGERYSLTYAKLADIDLLNGADPSAIVRAYDGGVIVLSRGSDREATVRLEKGLTTFTSKTDPARPRAIFSVPKFIATMHGLQEDLVSWADDNIIGQTTVDQETRVAVLAQINTFMRARELSGSVQAGWAAYIDPSPPPSDDDPFIAFVITAKFGRSTEQVYFTGQLG